MTPGAGATGPLSGTAVGSRASTVSLGSWIEPALVGLAGFLLASVVAASNGGYFSDSWAWVGFVSLCIATLRLILVPALPMRRLDVAFICLLSLFATWMTLSILWAPAATPTVNETIRDFAYAAAGLALLLVVRRRTVESLLVGVVAGVTLISGYSLLTRLHPDWVGNWDPATLFRLSGPIGYWNGLGLYAAMGTLLALGLAARSNSKIVQAAAAAAPVVLVPTMLFTFSRGAWLALLVGLVAVALLDANRLQLLAAGIVLAPWPALVVLLARNSTHLTRSDITLQQAADEGNGLLVWILALSVAAAVAMVAFRLVGARVHLSTTARRLIGALALAAAAFGVVAVFAVAGSPWTLAHRGVESFRAVPRQTGTDVTGRLFDLSSNGRVDQWRVSLDQFRDHRVVGAGGGSYAAAWNLERPRESVIQDAHSLYLEVLGELGIVGLAILLLALATPLVAAVRARKEPMVAGAFAAYCAFLAHAAIDWDWELAGVMLVVLAVAAALIVAARRGNDDATPHGVLLRIGLPVITGTAALVALAAVLATVPLGRARVAYDRLDFAEAQTQAQKAADWAPWSSEALDILGRSQLAQGKRAAAQASFESAVAKSPNDWELWRDLSAALPPAQARAALRRAEALNPLESELKQLQDAITAGPS